MAVTLVVQAAEVGVSVRGRMYSGSRSLSELMTNRFDGARDFESPLE